MHKLEKKKESCVWQDEGTNDLQKWDREEEEY